MAEKLNEQDLIGQELTIETQKLIGQLNMQVLQLQLELRNTKKELLMYKQTKAAIEKK